MLSECPANSAFLVKCHSEITGFPRLRDQWDRQLRCEGHQLGIGREAFGVAIDTSSTDISHIQQYKTISVLARRLCVSNHVPSTALGVRLCHGQYLIPFPKTGSKKKTSYIELTPCCTIKFQDHCCSTYNILIRGLWSLPVASLSCGCRWSIETWLEKCNNEITYTLCQIIYLYSHINVLTYTVLLFRIHAYNHAIVTNK